MSDRRETMRRSRTLLAGLGLLTVIGIAGCSSGSDDAATATSTATVAATATATSDAPTATVAPTDSPTAPSESSTATAGTVSANDASIAELTAAFEAAGISNAARWAREVDEYRPYPTDDPDLAKLRANLAKYNPGDGVVDAIVATLSLP